MMISVQVKLVLNFPEILVKRDGLQQMKEWYLLHQNFAPTYMVCTCKLRMRSIKMFLLAAAKSSAFFRSFYICSRSGNLWETHKAYASPAVHRCSVTILPFPYSMLLLWLSYT